MPFKVLAKHVSMMFDCMWSSCVLDGLIGELAADYATVCERNGVVPLEVQLNAPRIGPFINVVSREDSEPGTVDELHIAGEFLETMTI